MNRVLLVDDSPHAQRIGERILSDEGFEVVTVSNADSAFVRLEDADPDVVIADTVMPGRTGFEICQYIKVNPRFRHVRVILTAGVLEPFDDEQIKRAGADATLKKPFEASLLVATVKPLAEASRLNRERIRAGIAPAGESAAPATPAPTAFVAVVEPDQVRAAVTVALDASMEAMIDEISRRVMAALRARPALDAESQPVTSALPAQPVASAPPVPAAALSASEPEPAVTPAAPPALAIPSLEPVNSEPVRRVHAVRLRPRGSVLGLDSYPPDSETPPDSQR
jgi:CheY-like chemotaxis protein